MSEAIYTVKPNRYEFTRFLVIPIICRVPTYSSLENRRKSPDNRTTVTESKPYTTLRINKRTAFKLFSNHGQYTCNMYKKIGKKKTSLGKM